MNRVSRENGVPGCADARCLGTRSRAGASKADLRRRRDAAVDAGGLERVGTEFHEDLAWERVVSYVQVGDVDYEMVGVVASGETDEDRRNASTRSSSVGGALMPTKLRARRQLPIQRRVEVGAHPFGSNASEPG